MVLNVQKRVHFEGVIEDHSCYSPHYSFTVVVSKHFLIALAEMCQCLPTNLTPHPNSTPSFLLQYKLNLIFNLLHPLLACFAFPFGSSPVYEK